MGKTDVNDLEVKEIRNKYKKLRNIILVIILIFLVVFLINFAKDVIILNKIFENNIEVDCGENYKMILTQDDSVSVNYFKGNRSKHVAGVDGENVLLWDGNVPYIILHDTKEYYEYPENEMMMFKGENRTVTFFPTLVLQKESVDSLFDVIKDKIIFRMSVGTEMIDGEEYYVVDVHSDIKMWISKADYRCIKEISYGQVKKVEVIKNVVTDEDMKNPVELGYTKLELNNN